LVLDQGGMWRPSYSIILVDATETFDGCWDRIELKSLTELTAFTRDAVNDPLFDI
jgi:hypothetical protein